MKRNACQTPKRSKIFFGGVKLKGKEKCKGGKVQLYKEGRPYVFLSCESFFPSPNPQINWLCLQATLSKCPGYVCMPFNHKRNVLHAWRLSRKCRIIRSRSYRKCVGPHCKHCERNGLVRALSLDVAGLLALVASTLAAGLGGAVSGEMTDLTAVVALLALGAITRHVTVTTAGVAGLSTLTSAATEAATATVSLASTISTALASVCTRLRAVASNVADL